MLGLRAGWGADGGAVAVPNERVIGPPGATRSAAPEADLSTRKWRAWFGIATPGGPLWSPNETSESRDLSRGHQKDEAMPRQCGLSYLDAVLSVPSRMAVRSLRGRLASSKEM
jgi:hypothetical protein